MTYAEIQSLIYNWTNTNATSFPAATLNLYTQPAEEEVAALVLENDSKWQYDDLNRTTNFPIDTIALVSGQQDYPLGTTYLSLDRVELLPNGVSSTTGWTRLRQLDQQDLKSGSAFPDTPYSLGVAQSLTSYQSGNGQPLEYDLVGNSIFLYPAPNYSQAASLKFYYTRGPLKFDYTTSKFTDGTGSTASTPGFYSLCHKIIAHITAVNYAGANVLPNLSWHETAIQQLSTRIVKYYAKRNRDRAPRMTMQKTQYM